MLINAGMMELVIVRMTSWNLHLLTLKNDHSLYPMLCKALIEIEILVQQEKKR